MPIHPTPKLAFVALAQTQEHPLSLRLAKQYSIAPFTRILPKLLLQKGLLSLSRQLIFDAIPSKGRYYCVTNLRLYALLKHLPPGTPLCVRVCSRLNEEQITQRVLTDLLILPALNGLTKRDLPRLADVWERLRAHPIFTELFDKTGVAGLARLLHTGFRSVRRTHG